MWRFSALVLSFLATSAISAQNISMINDTYEPFVMDGKNPNLPGIDIEIASIALKKAGYDFNFKVVPWSRVLDELKRGKADMTTTLSWKEERDAFLDWSIPYRTTTTYLFLYPKDKPLQIKSLKDLEGKKIAGIRDFTYPKDISENSKIRIEGLKSLDVAVEFMLQGRADLVIANSVQGIWEIKTKGLAEKVAPTEFKFQSQDEGRGTMMGFSKSRNLKSTIEKFNKALEEMIKSGEIQKIEEKYLK